MQGIYQIRNIDNNKVYIGSSIDIEFRWNTHKNELNKGKHVNFKLQDDWNEYGEDSFIFEVLEQLEECSKEELFLLEQKYIDKYKPYLNGYNMSHKVTGMPIKRNLVVYNDINKYTINKNKIVDTVVRRIGNSKGVILPSEFLKKLYIFEGDTVFISLEDGEIKIRNAEQMDENDKFKRKVLAIIDEYMKEHEGN